ncbi:MAG TPA: PsiF family protein [Rhizomicrobium sp.]
MRATLALTSLLPLVLLATPAAAATQAEKMETCKFGAEHDNLGGAKRDAFIKKCMANANYEPAARKEALKRKPAGAKPAAAPAATDEDAEEKPQ